jgi:hypothetical protein
LPPIRADLSRLGIRLQTRVHVKLISRSELLDAIPGAGYRTWGFTMSRIDAVGPAVDTNIGVLAGLPYELFGMTVSHEAGHAWLHQNGGPLQDRATEEGFCNLVAAAWLKGRGTPMAEQLLTSLLADPDPVYGDGYRSVRTAAKQHGVASVIETLTREGRLP